MGPVRGKEGDRWALCGARKETDGPCVGQGRRELGPVWGKGGTNRSGVRQSRYVWALFDLLKKTDGPHVSQRRPAGHVSTLRNTVCWALLES
jgi:hypothetical protein